MRGHEGIKYHCRYCSKSFQDKRGLEDHLSQHTGKYKFTCDLCGEGFNMKYSYENHMIAHKYG